MKVFAIALIAAMLAAACVSPQGALLDEGNAAFETGDFDAAAQSYQKAQVESPDVAEPYYNAGNALLRRQENEDAVRHLQQALKTADPELTSDAAFNLGNAHFEQGDFDAAVEAYKESLRVDPGAPDAKHNLELALQRAEEQQQDETQTEDGEEEEDARGGEQDERPDEGQDEEETEPADEPPQPGESPQDTQDDALTEEQARRLLDALAQDAEALQQRLQFNGGDPRRPAQDW